MAIILLGILVTYLFFKWIRYDIYRYWNYCPETKHWHDWIRYYDIVCLNKYICTICDKTHIGKLED